jgi:hypothetical protein
MSSEKRVYQFVFCNSRSGLAAYRKDRRIGLGIDIWGSGVGLETWDTGHTSDEHRYHGVGKRFL